MNLTISELAVAVDRTESYIRQHVHRNHLKVTKAGRRVYVEFDEARRWAKERGITFRPPHSALASIMQVRDRAARMTVLVWKAPDGHVENLFTLVRHRRKDGLGPWQPEPAEEWRSEQLTGELLLFAFDAPLDICESIVDRILDSGTLRVNDCRVQFALEPIPRHHWAYRVENAELDQSVRSPFARHSAEIREYWSFADQPRQRWRKELEASLNSSQSLVTRLGFPLESRSDRVGNLMIAGAEDAITCDLNANHDRALSLKVEADNYEPGSYNGLVWASHSGDEVLRQQLAITPGEVVLPLRSDVDRVGFAMFRDFDGQCVDLMSQDLMMEVVVRLNAQMGPNIRLQDRTRKISSEVNPFHRVSETRVQTDEHSPDLDKGIRQQRLDHNGHQRESVARKRGDLARFIYGMRRQAVDHLLAILREDRKPPAPIYFADPYFMDSAKSPDEIELWLQVFAATAGSPLYILCGKDRLGGRLPKWWSNSPRSIISHVRARVFTRHTDRHTDGKPAFHDRYLITPEREVLITHSVSGWEGDGVTFASLPFGVYRAEAEQFWNMKLQSGPARAWAEELR